MDLNFSIKNQMIKRTDENILVNKSKNYLNCIFEFQSEEWENIDKFAIFKDSWGHSYKTILGNENTCECLVPNEVLKGTSFQVSLYCGDLITTNELTVILIPSGYTTQFTLPDDCEDKDVFVKIFEELNTKLCQVIQDENTIYCYTKNGLLCQIDLSPVAVTGNYNDLNNIPETFNPASHTHVAEEIIDFDDTVGVNFRILANLIRKEN